MTLGVRVNPHSWSAGLEHRHGSDCQGGTLGHAMTSDPDGDLPRTLISRRRYRLFKVYRVTAQVLVGYGVLVVLGIFRRTESKDRALARYLRRSARRVRHTILDVQGLFIKVGQMISILTNFLPAEFRDQLEGLQDQIPPRPLAEIHGRLRREFGKDARELFKSFDPEPVASASLAQVHAAELDDGRRVAVKVQHFDIEELAQLDLRAIRRILQVVQVVMRIRGLTTVFSEVREMIEAELDFAQEAEHIETIGANFASDPMVCCPDVIHERSTHRVLTTHFVDGTKVTDLDALAAKGIAPEPVAERVVRAYCQMIFVDGVYHADPHPGNILVRDDGGVVFIDFGATARLSPAVKEGIPQLLQGVLRRDKEEILRAMQRIGFVLRDDSQETAEQVIDYLYSRFLDQIELDSWNLKDIRVDTRMKMEFIADMNRLDISLRQLTSTFQIPREWILLQRTLVLLMGLATHLHPEMRPITIIRPYLEEFVLGEDRDWMGLVTQTVKDLALSVLTIPDDLKRLLAQARRGDARLEIRGLREGANLLYALGHQLLYGGFALGTGALAYLAESRGDNALVMPLAAASGFFVLCLGGSMLRARKWQKELRRRSR